MILDNKTKIELWAVLGVVPVFCGLVFWITMIYFTASASQVTNEKQDAKLDSQMQILLDIRDRITRVEQKIDRSK